MAVLKTESLDLTALVGQILEPQFDFFVDDALTVPFDLTGYTFTVVLKPPSMDQAAVPVSPTPTVVAAQGLVAFSQDTTGWQVGRGRWYLQAVDSSGAKSYPLRGLLFVGNP